MKINRNGLILSAVSWLWSSAAALSAPSSIRIDSIIETPPPEQSPASNSVVEIKLREKAPEKSSDLHRLDFRMEGKSCPVCLLSIQNKLKSLNGVQDAAVMLKRPFGVSVIYKAEKANSTYILTTLREKEPAIKVFDVVDKKIEKPPQPLIPPFMPVVEPVKPIPDDTKPLSERP